MSKEVKELKQQSFCWGCQAFVSELNIDPFCIEMYLVLTFLTAFLFCILGKLSPCIDREMFIGAGI